MLRIIAPILATTLFVGSGFAQTSPKPDGQWRGALGMGASLTAGNTDSVTYSINGDIVRQTPIDKVSGYLQAVSGRRKESGTTIRTANQARAGVAYTRDAYGRDNSDRWFRFGQLDLDRNPLIDLYLRSVVAAGIGYHVVRREGLTLDVSTGPAYNRERFTSETRAVAEWLVAEESTHALSSMISFKQKLSFYANLQEGGEYRAVFDAGLVFKVNDRWNATMTLNSRYQSNPLPGTEKGDTLFVTGLQYVFNP